MGTSGEEWEISGGLNQGITPSNVRARSHTTHGAANVIPLRIGTAVLFVQKAGKKLRELRFSDSVDQFNARDLTLLNPDITGQSTIVDMAYQQEPFSMVWCVLADGTLLALTYDSDQNIWAWSRHTTGASGLFRSVAIIPHPTLDRDRVWFIIDRTIDSVAVSRFEYLDDDVSNTVANLGDLHEWLKVDSALRVTIASGNTVTGLAHLEAETVEIVADGIRRTPATVSGGSVTFDGAAATVVDVGIGFTSTLQTLRPGVPDQQNNFMGFFKRWVKSLALVLNSGPGMTINGDDATAEGEPAAPATFSGFRPVLISGYDEDARITIVQTQPYPATILAITGILEIGDQ